MLCLPGLLQPESLFPWQAIADPRLCREHSNTKAGLAQSLVGPGVNKALQVSLACMGFDSKYEFIPPTILLGLLLYSWMWVFCVCVCVFLFSGSQHPPVDGCSAASCNLGVLTGEAECMSFYSAILRVNPCRW